MTPDEKSKAVEKTTAFRLNTLSQISGLRVSCHYERGIRCFVFGPSERPLKCIMNYKKAKAFASGVAVGRFLSRGNDA